ncbi:MAG TPA: hypothetical protein VE957_16280 [Terriglobales bacterium]|nr:hypothetical protein [Terriglobales bacterium]
MSKHDSVTKRNRRPKSEKRVDYTARTMAALKELEQAAKLKVKAIKQAAEKLRRQPGFGKGTTSGVPATAAESSPALAAEVCFGPST